MKWQPDKKVLLGIIATLYKDLELPLSDYARVAVMSYIRKFELRLELVRREVEKG